MNFDDRAIERNGIHSDADYLLLLEPLENPVKHAVFAPAAHAGVDTVPIAKPFRQAAPFTSIFSHIQDRIENKKVVKLDVPPLTGKAGRYFFVLLTCYFHEPIITKNSTSIN